MSHINQDQVKRLCEDLVYQVGYAFYDVPYIILLNLMVQFGVAREGDLHNATHITPNEIRKYMGMLLSHRLIKRHANKERIHLTEYQSRQAPNHRHQEPDRPRLKEVIYYYLDYREFANVVKYRIAMMRKGIDEKQMQDVGHKGYICPLCSRAYSALQIPTLFSPAHNAFLCEDDKTELIEHVPDETDSSDKMQRFNRATQPIRDALRAVEGLTLPTVNILAWVAENVKSTVVLAEEDGEGPKGGKVQVVLGGEGEREKLERERLAEQQRTQNVLPIWHTHSTVTGTATTLGLADQTRAAQSAAERTGQGGSGAGEADDSVLLQHYERADGGGEGDQDDDDGNVDGTPDEDIQYVKIELEADEEEEDGDMARRDPRATDGASGVVAAVTNGTNGHTPTTAASTAPNGAGKTMVNVNGVPKALEDITDEDQDEMTPDEYQAYYDAALAA